MMQFLDISNTDVCDGDGNEEQAEEQLMLENGVDWCPRSTALVGDLKEVQGLFDKGVFVNCKTERPEGRCTPMGLVRRWNGDVLKSRLCLTDVAHTRAHGG